LYGCETSSLALREEHRLRVFENWMLRKIFGPKRYEVIMESKAECIKRGFILCIPHQILFM
jgi:hypothetical protein